LLLEDPATHLREMLACLLLAITLRDHIDSRLSLKVLEF
jgi:hypothetical protein